MACGVPNLEGDRGLVNLDLCPVAVEDSWDVLFRELVVDVTRLLSKRPLTS